MADFNWIQTIYQSGVTISAFGGFVWLFKRWMNQRESSESEIRINAAIQTEKVARELQTRHEQSCIEIKQQIADNKAFYKETYNDLKNDIGKVAELQKIANGRTGKLEVKFATLEQAHKDRVCEQ
jgi:hypothetical protein